MLERGSGALVLTSSDAGVVGTFVTVMSMVPVLATTVECSIGIEPLTVET